MNRNVLIIIAAAVLIELFSAVQYYTAHGLVEEQLDYRAENEIRIKAIVIKGILNLQENTLRYLLRSNTLPLLTVESPDLRYVYSICYISR